MLKNLSISLLLNLILTSLIWGQTADNPVLWSVSSENIGEQEYMIQIEGKLFEGFHTYSQFLSGDEGPVPTWIQFQTGKSFELVGEAEEIGLEKHFDPVWELEIGSFSKKALFKQKVKMLNPDSTLLKGFINFMACNEEMCMPPEYFDFEVDLTSGSGNQTLAEDADNDAAMNILPEVKNLSLANPVNDCGDSSNNNEEKRGYWKLLLLGFLGGLVSLITPCVFPMIPLTVSFFTKGGSEKGKGIAKALLYGLSIVLVYVSLSLPFYFSGTDPEVLNQISTSFWLNIAFFSIFLVFAFSFFGFYELTLPSSWANKADKAADLGGFIGVIFMALVLAIVSFSCTGPLLGSVLAGSLKDGPVPITMAMLGFGLGLGLPFTLFAAFPSMLKSLPQSGGWLNTVKVVLGFVELGLALKFLSNADFVYRYGIVLRETFYLVWIIIAVATAFYLWGFFKFPHDSPNAKIGKARAVIGVIFVSFGIYLIPGVLPQEKQFWNTSLISGFPPSTWYSWYAIEDEEHPHFTDYNEALSYAKEHNKKLLIDFTGYACVNCRKMEENVWTQDKVKEILEREYVIVSLYVDDKVDLPKDQQTTIEIPLSDGTTKQKKLRTVGDKWATFESLKFGQVSQPFYVLLSPDEYLLTNPVGYTPNIDEYAEWLLCGAVAFDKLNDGYEVEIDKSADGIAVEEVKPVTWSFSATKSGGDEYTLNLDGILDEGWHTYSQYLSSMEGPLPTWITYEPSDAYELIDSTYEENTHTHYDETFEMEITDFDSKAIFKQKIKVKTGEKFVVKGNINFMVCEEGRCLPPEDQPFEIEITP